MNKNIWEIQDLYMDEEQQGKDKEKVEEEEVILIKSYEVLKSISTKSSSFIDKEINNLIKYMKFIKSSTQTRIFWPPPHYKLLQSSGEQDPDFWKEVATVYLETSRNRYPIKMFQERLPHEPFFITVDNQGQVIISSNKKMVAMYVVEELEVLV